MYAYKRRATWGCYSRSAADDSVSSGHGGPSTERSPLNPKRRNTDNNAQPEEKTGHWFGSLCKRYGWPYIVTVVVYVHLIDGFASQTITMASPYVFRAYEVTAPVAQLYQSVSETPFAMKAVIGLISDVLPVRGYNKAPYIMLASVFGCVSMGCTGLFPDTALPLSLIVVFLFLANLEISVADTLSQGAFASKVRRSLSPQRGMELITFVFLGGNFFSLLAVIFAGILLTFTGARTLYIVAAGIALISIYPAAAGWLEEKWVSPEATREIRALFWQEKEACIYNVILFVMTVIFTVVIMFGKPVVAGVVGVAILFTAMAISTLVFNPTIAKVNAFQLLMISSTINIRSAEFYFFTDSAAQFPEGPHFSNWFFNAVIGGCVFLGMMTGTYTHRLLSERFTYRGWIVIANVGFSVVNVLAVLLYKRVMFGIPPWLFACVTVFGTCAMERWKLMPVIVMVTNLCPADMETTIFGGLIGTFNLSQAIAACFGACALRTVGCHPAGLKDEGAAFDHFWLAACWNSVVPLAVSLAFIWLVPAVNQRGNLLGSSGKPTSGSVLNRLRDHFGWGRSRKDDVEEACREKHDAAEVSQAMGASPPHPGVDRQ